MGKRTSGLTGLSRLAREVFGEPPARSNPDAKPTSTGPPPCEHTEKAPEASQTTPITSAKTRSPPMANSSTKRPNKRRKTSQGNGRHSWRTEWEKKYDATGLVPHYKTASEAPDYLQKYFSQRKRYFSLYEEGCLLDEEGWYSVTPERVADQIAERCRCDTVLDAFCGVGGNAIAFAKTCERVIALDNSATRLALARHNAVIYGVADRIEFILTDYISFAHAYLSVQSQHRNRKIDVVFLSPPWGGPSYLSGSGSPTAGGTEPVSESQMSEQVPVEEVHPEYTLASIQPIHGAELFKLSRQITNNIAYFLPRNTCLEEISALLNEEDDMPNWKGKGKARELDKTLGPELVEVEEEWMGTKLKALTCYFGGLAAGQGHLF